MDWNQINKAADDYAAEFYANKDKILLSDICTTYRDAVQWAEKDAKAKKNAAISVLLEAEKEMIKLEQHASAAILRMAINQINRL